MSIDPIAAPNRSADSTPPSDTVCRVPAPSLLRGDSIGSAPSPDRNGAALRDLASATKNATIGTAAHRIVPHRYELRSIETKLHPKTGAVRNTSVAGVFDKRANVSSKNGKARGEFQVRFDRAHDFDGKPLGPHINIGTGEHRSTPVQSTVVEGAGKAARALEAFDKVAAPIGIAVDSVRLGSAYHSDGSCVGPNTMHTAGSVVGGWAGGLGGAWMGAEGGALVGALAGPPGAAVGAVVGGLIGGIGGAYGGSTAGETIADKATQRP